MLGTSLRTVAAVVLPAAATALPVSTGAAHPVHASFAELAYDPAARSVTVTLRVFADDFAAEVARRTDTRPGADGVPPDGAVLRYVTPRFTVVAPRGGTLAFRSCGTRRAGIQLLVCLRAPAAAFPAGGRVRSAVLSDAFRDQVNVVRVAGGARPRTLVFVAGDGAKPL